MPVNLLPVERRHFSRELCPGFSACSALPATRAVIHLHLLSLNSELKEKRKILEQLFSTRLRVAYQIFTFQFITVANLQSSNEIILWLGITINEELN